jgi:hypothetical protein
VLLGIEEQIDISSSFPTARSYISLYLVLDSDKIEVREPATNLRAQLLHMLPAVSPTIMSAPTPKEIFDAIRSIRGFAQSGCRGHTSQANDIPSSILGGRTHSYPRECWALVPNLGL